MEQVRIDFLVTGSMGGMHKQVQALNAELMQTAGSVNLLDKNLSKLDVMSAHRQFGQMVTSSGMFDHQIVSLDTHTKQFADSLNKARLTGRQYYGESMKYLRGQRGEIAALAKQQVRMQNSVITPTGRNAAGQMTAGVTTPTGLATDAATNLRVANKQWEIFNRTAQQGATQMVNWGKNTQWAGRQLMVGFTIPLMIAGGLAAKTFKDIDEQLVRLTKVYGSGFTFGDDYAAQAAVVREAGMKMASDMAQAYGQAGEETIALMADLAAVGLEGQDLARMTEQTTRLATLGEVDRQQAMDATISMQTAFKMSTEEVATSVNFLNAVENQTSATLSDLTEAIPRAGTVVKALGGDMQDLSLYMVAFREGGISAAEGANALKSGLSSIIAPPKAAVEFLNEFGINLPRIVNQNAGDLTGTILEFQQSLMGLDKLAQQQVITKLFGKYQFARMSAFFNNLGAKGSQTLDVMKLMGVEASTLAKAADQEIKAGADSASGEWKRQWESFRVTIAKVGKEIMGWGTTVLKILNKAFGFLADNQWLLNIIKYAGLVLAGIGPVVMMMGLFGNIIGTVLKGVLRLVNGFKVLTSSGGGIKKSFEMMTAESFAADAGLDRLTESMWSQTTAMNVLEEAARHYVASLEQIAVSSRRAKGAAVGSPVVPPTSGGGWKQTSNQVEYGTLPMSRAHFIPTSVSSPTFVDSNSKAMQDMLKQEMGYLPEQGRAYNFKNMGWAFSSKQANVDASNTMPFFNTSKTSAQIAALSVQQQRALVDVVKFTEIQAAKLAEAGVADQKIVDWKKKVLNDAAAAAKNSKDALAAERAYVQAVKSSTELRYGANYFKKKPTIGASSNIAGAMTPSGFYKNDAEMMLAQPGGVADSWMVADQKYAAQIEKAVVILEKENVEATKTTIAKRKYAFMIDSLARSVGDDAASMANKIPFERLEAAMNNMSQGVDEASLKFQLIEQDGQTLLVAMDKATGSLMGVANQMPDGGFRQLPKSAPRMGRVADVGIAQQMAVIENEIRQTAQGRAAIESQIRRDAKIRQEEERVFQKLEAAEQRKALEMQRAGMKIVQSELSAEQKIAALRKAGLINEEQKLTFTKMGLTAEEMATLQDLEQLMLEKSQTVAKGGGSGGFFSGLLGKFKGPKAMGIGGAAMMLPMATSMIAPPGSALSSMSNYAMMGSMAGVFGGPMAMAAGTAGGFAVGGVIEAIKYAKERSDKAAAETAAEWELQFSGMQLDDAVAKSLGLKSMNDAVKINFVPVDASKMAAYKDVSEEKRNAIVEGYKNEIQSLKDATSETDKLASARRLYASIVAAGNSQADAARILSVIMDESDNMSLLNESISSGVSSQTEAFKFLLKDVADRQKALDETIGKNMRPPGGGVDKGWAMSRETYGNMMAMSAEAVAKAGTEQGKLWAEKFTYEVGLGLKQGNAFGIEKNMDTFVRRIASSSAASLNTIDTDALGKIFEHGGIDVMSKNHKGLKDTTDLMYEFVFANDDAKEAMLTSSDLGAYPELNKQLHIVDSQMSAYLEQLKLTNPALAEQIAYYESIGNTAAAARLAIDALKESQKEQALLDQFTKSAYKYIPKDSDVPDKVNINKLQRQKDKELEALQEARLEAMQKAADKRERLMQREIDKTGREYDKQIAQIQRVEEKRQEAAQAEEDRFARRQELRNMEISYQEAIANGDLFEAARIRMDMAAKKKQEDAKKKEERAQAKADKKVRAVEKEKNQELRIMEKALRVEQRMNERAIEAAQEKSDAKIEAAQKAADAEIRLAEKGNKTVEKNEKQHLDKVEKMFQALLDGNMQAFNKYANQLNMTQNQKIKAMTDFAQKKFGDLPKDAWNAVSKAIRSGDWQLLGQLMQGKIRGLSKSQLADISRMYGNRQSIPGEGNGDVARATGGYVSGPGTGTSDSINARLSNGEYVIRQSSVAKYGKGAMDAINAGQARLPGFAEGGQFGIGAPILEGILDKPLDIIGRMLSAAAGKPGTKTGAVPGTPGQYGSSAFDAQQLKMAATIISVGKSMGASHRDLLIGLMTAMQESTLHNYKTAVDHDSLGLFQQRPSMGWGTAKQITNPKYASRKFFQSLLGISGRDGMTLAAAAQAVQRSAYPDAYAKWEDEARAVLAATGKSGKYFKPWVGNHPIGRTFQQHGRTGTDIPMPTGTALRAVAGGKLTNMPYAAGSYGNWYTLDANGTRFVYAHLSRDKANSGTIGGGSILGYSGSTGNSTGPHLHFEARSGDGRFTDQFDPRGMGIPGLRSGGKINYDNTLANLHRGETVLTAPLTNAFENNVANSGGGTYNFNVDKIELHKEMDLEREFSRFVTAHERRQQVRAGRSRRI
jgi:TP901 family phage tail tape measure protein